MGSTVTINRSVAAFSTPAGKIAYILFEETYEKNVHPHTPYWECRFIGFLAAAVTYIFDRASCVESGMLQSRNGSLTAEGYIASWMEKMAAPVFMENRLIEIRNTGRYDTPLPASQATDVCTKLRAAGRDDLAIAVETGKEFSLRLHEDFDLLASIYGGRSMGAWRIIAGRFRPTAGVVEGLGYRPEPVHDAVVATTKVLRADRENVLLLHPDGVWRCAGWRYEAVGKFIREQGEVELREPGAYAKRIKAYRKAVHEASPMPKGGKIVVDRRIPVEDQWDRDRIERMGKEFPVVLTNDGYEVEVVQSDDFLWAACSLPRSSASWVFPECVGHDDQVQMSLLSA